MKHIIKKILKEESFKQSLKQMVKEFGWETTAEMVNGSEELSKSGFNNDPMEFLHMFNDLDVAQSEIKPDWYLVKQENGKNLMAYNKKRGLLYVVYESVLSFLTKGFKLEYDEILALIKKWADKSYNLKGLETHGVYQYAIEQLG